LKTTLVWTLLLMVFVALFQLTGEPPAVSESFDTFLAHVEAGEVAELRIQHNELTVTRWDGYRYATLGVVNDELTRQLSEAGVVMSWGEASNPLRTILLTLVPIVLLIAFFVYFVRRARRAAWATRCRSRRAERGSSKNPRPCSRTWGDWPTPRSSSAT
jgi:ATP-dependent Zn protease